MGALGLYFIWYWLEKLKTCVLKSALNSLGTNTIYNSLCLWYLYLLYLFYCDDEKRGKIYTILNYPTWISYINTHFY